MLTRSFVIKNKSGLHVRPASVLASALSAFESDVLIEFMGGRYNAKSPIKILSAQIKAGDAVTLTVEGPDELAAMEQAAALIESGLSE